jgi:hypothetical protein
MTSIRPVVSRFSGKYPPRNRMANSGSQGEITIRPAIASEFGEADVRPVSDVAGAPLPHHRPQFRSRSSRLHPHQATREHRYTRPGQRTPGNCIRERDCIAYGNLASAGTAHGAITSAVAKREKSRKYREVSLAPLAGDYARPAAWPYRSQKPTETCHVPAPLAAWPGG